MNDPLSRRQRRDRRVFEDGLRVALDQAIPALERKYRVATLWRVWLLAVSGFALGLVLGWLL